MARIDDLLENVNDAQLRAALAQAVNDLRRRKRFGLVYEEHVPETAILASRTSIRVGSQVILRKAPQDKMRFVVEKVSKDKATITNGSESRTVVLDDLFVVKPFGEPVYPILRPLESFTRSESKPFHVVINGENFHALELLLFAYRERVDCIYIDPPYNTGNGRDWKYNNDYVDESDRYRHSKWLAFMHHRLSLAKRLLNPAESVLIVTIGEDEVHALGLLLTEVFRGAKIQMVTSVINPRGKYREGEFARCEEHIFFVTLGRARVAGQPDEDYGEGSSIAWRTFRRSDISSARGTPKGGPSQFYPIYVEDQSKRISAIGDALPSSVPRTAAPSIKGCTAVFPVREDGTEMNWGLTAGSARSLLSRGYIKVGKHEPENHQTYVISYLTSGKIKDISSGRATVVGFDDTGAAIVVYAEDRLRMPLSTWVRPSHNAEVGGTNLIKDLLGAKLFDYPKSLYAVEDALAYFIEDKPNAIVLDFFGGSGTTSHAVMRLNHRDGGARQSILVTNNEVSGRESDAMRAEGIAPGDDAWAARGIFQRVTRPRVIAALTGRRPDGSVVEGNYRFQDEFPIGDGFDENVAFFDMDYEDPDRIEVGAKFEEVLPALWLAAGAHGDLATQNPEVASFISSDKSFAVLLDEDRFRDFADLVREMPALRHIWLVTDSESAFSRMRDGLRTRATVGMLFRDYLRNFSVNTGGRW